MFIRTFSANTSNREQETLADIPYIQRVRLRRELVALVRQIDKIDQQEEESTNTIRHD